MNERVVPGPVQDSCGIREAVCIHTKKIYDSCRDKDCIEDLRVYPTRASQAVIDRALSVRGGRAELLQAYIDVEPASYNRGFYSVDIRYYYRITAEAFVGGSRPAEICGLPCSTSGCCSSAVKAAQKFSPPAITPMERTARSWAGATCQRPWWRLWTPSC